MGKSMKLSTIPRTNTRRTNMNMIPTNTSLNTVTKRTNMTTSTTTTSTAMRLMITNLTMATRRTRTVTIMVMATNNTEAMDVSLTDTVTNLPMVTDTNLTDMDPDHLMADTDNLMVDMDNNPTVMVMDTNLNTATA